LASCQPEVDKFELDEFDAPGDVYDALNIIQNDETIRVISIDNETTLMVDRILFYFPSNIFLDENNEIVTHDIEIRTIILNEKRDFLKYDISSEDENHVILETELAFSLQAYKNNRPLHVNPASNGITVQIFDAQPKEESLYLLDDNEQNNLWVMHQTDVASGELFVELNGMGFDTTGYEVVLNSLSWFGLQSPLNRPLFTSICLKLLESNTPANTRAFLLYDDYNICQRLNLSAKGECELTSLPAGVEGNIVVIAHKGEDKLELAWKREFVDNAIRDVEIEPIRVTEEEFISLVESL
jgi:hypothetical protein